MQAERKSHERRLKDEINRLLRCRTRELRYLKTLQGFQADSETTYDSQTDEILAAQETINTIEAELSAISPAWKDFYDIQK